MRVVLVAALATAAVAGCSEDKADQCMLSSTTSMLQAADRKIVGIAVPYPADLTLHDREDELNASVTARRAAAWSVVERVLTMVPLGEARLADLFGGVQPVIPAWHTWYG